MEAEKKAVVTEFKFEGTKLIAAVALDSNKDGQNLVKLALEIDLAEIPEEIFAAIQAAKSK
jgi:hypothetical protein